MLVKAMSSVIVPGSAMEPLSSCFEVVSEVFRKRFDFAWQQALAGKEKQQRGHECCNNNGYSQDNNEKLKVKGSLSGCQAYHTGQNLFVKFAKFCEVIEVLDQNGEQKDKKALKEEENDRHHAESLCALCLLGGDCDRDKTGDQEVDKQQGAESLKWLPAAWA